MRTYAFYLTAHITGIVACSITGVFLLTHHLWFSAVACALLLLFLSIRMYRIQIRQTKMLQKIVACVKSQSLSEKINAPFENRTVVQLAGQLSVLLQEQKEKLQKEEARFHYYELLLQEVDTALVVANDRGLIEWSNRAAKQLFGNQMRLPENIRKDLDTGLEVTRYEDGNRRMDLALSQNRMLVRGKEKNIISMKNLHDTLNRTEMEAWQKLIRVLTHEIMNSITPIISLSDTLCERSSEGPLSESAQNTLQQGLGIIHRRCKGLLGFVENYRKLTRITAPMKARIPVQEFLEDLKRLLNDDSIRLINETGNTVWNADRTQMEQVFLNLLKNAREACHNRPDPKITIHAFCRKKLICFSVTDNGEGILPEVRERIFVPFFTTKPNGSGIGLSLCRQIVTLHDGCIFVLSEPGQGCTFTMEFPAG